MYQLLSQKINGSRDCSDLMYKKPSAPQRMAFFSHYSSHNSLKLPQSQARVPDGIQGAREGTQCCTGNSVRP